MKKVLFFLFVFVSFSLLQAAQFQVRVLNRPDAVPIGAPGYVTVEMTNISGGPVTVAYIAHSGFRGKFEVKRADGKPRHGCREKGHEDSLGPNYEVLPADWRKVKTEDVFEGCKDEPGEYVVQFILSSNDAGGRILDGGHVRMDKSLKAWTGAIRSEELRIEIVTPIGEDKEAYDAYQACMGQIATTKTGSWEQCRDKILSDHPTSIYAAWAAHGLFYGPAEQAVSNQRWKEAKYPERLFIEVFPAKEETKTLLAVVEATLRQQPNFQFLTDMKYAQVSLLLQLDRRKEAIQRLELYSKDDNKETSAWAQKYLEAYRILRKEGKLKD